MNFPNSLIGIFSVVMPHVGDMLYETCQQIMIIYYSVVKQYQINDKSCESFC